MSEDAKWPKSQKSASSKVAAKPVEEPVEAAQPAMETPLEVADVIAGEIPGETPAVVDDSPIKPGDTVVCVNTGNASLYDFYSKEHFPSGAEKRAEATKFLIGQARLGRVTLKKVS